MAEVNETQVENLQAQLDAVNNQIGQLTSQVAHYTDVVREVTEKLAQNKTAQEKIYEKYTEALKKVYGKSSEENITPSTLKELKAILSDFNKQKKAATNANEKDAIIAKINAIKADMDTLRDLNNEKKQLSADKTNANAIIKTSNDDITKLREGLLKINESQDKHLANIDKNSEELKEIHRVLEDIYDAMPESSDKEESSRLPEGYGDNNQDVDYQERRENLEAEVSVAEDLVTQFKELQSVIESKNSSLEDELDLIEKENVELEGAESRFTAMHREAGNINDELEDGRKTIAKTGSSAKSVGSGFLDVLGGIFKTIWDLTLGINDKWNEIDDKAYKYGRRLGMTASQMRSYRDSMMQENLKLMGAYHMTLEEITELQEGITDRTGRAIILTNQQKEALMATSKFVGADTTLAAAENMDKLGGSLVTSQEYLSVAMERARAQGLSMDKHTKNFADNMKLASRLNFKRGLSDIDKMTALTERMHTNLNDFTGMSETFKTIESSISASAKLQVLGGNFAANFGNPLEMMNMAKTDFAGMVEKFQQSIKDMGSFNEKSGMVEINAMNKDILEEAAKSLGINFEAALNAVNSEGKAKAIKAQTRGNLDDARQEWLNNNAEYNQKTGKWEVSYIDDNGYTQKKNVSDIKSSAELDQLRKTHSTEEQMQSDVHDIRNRLLGVKQKEGKNNTSSYLEIRDSNKDIWQVGMAGVITPLEEMKKMLAEKMTNWIWDTLTKVKEIATTIANWNLVEKFNWLLEKLGLNFKLGSGWNAVLGAGGVLVGIGAALYAIRHPISLLENIWEGLKGIGNLIGGGAKALTKAPAANATSGGGGTSGPTASGGNKPTDPKHIKERENVKKQYDQRRANIKNNTKLTKAERTQLLNDLNKSENAALSKVDAKYKPKPSKWGKVKNVAKKANPAKLLKKVPKGKAAIALAAIAGGTYAYNKFFGDSNETQPTEEEPEVQVEGDKSYKDTNTGLVPTVIKGIGEFSVKRRAASAVAKKLVGSAAKGGGVGFAAQMLADGANMGGQALGLWDEGSMMDKGLQIGSRTAEFAALGSVIPGIGTAIGAGIGAVYGVAEQFGDDMQKKSDELAANGNNVQAAAVQGITTVLGNVKIVCGTLENAIGDVVGGVVDGVMDSWDKLMEGDFLGAFNTLFSSIGNGIWSGVKDIAKGVVDLAKNTIEGAASQVGKLFGYQPEGTPRRENSFINITGDAVKSGWQTAKSYVKGAWNSFTSLFANGGIVNTKNYASGGIVNTKNYATGGIVNSDTKTNSSTAKSVKNTSNKKIIHASTGLQSVNFEPKGTDTVPAMLTPGEMILNSKQQTNLWGIINKAIPYLNPTTIIPSVSKMFSNKTSNSSSNSNHEINININISGSGNIQGLDRNAIQNAILDSTTLRKLHEALDRVGYTIHNGGAMENANSIHKLSHV